MNDFFMVGNAEHSKDRRCDECYVGYPQKCQCGGLIHAQFIKESWDKVLNLVHSCDKCGDRYKYITPKPVEKRKFRKRPKWKRSR